MAGTAKSKYEIETESAELGAAKKAERGDSLTRALASDLMQARELEDRQQRIGAKRRASGPAVEGEAEEEGGASAPEVSATDCDEPEGE